MGLSAALSGGAGSAKGFLDRWPSFRVGLWLDACADKPAMGRRCGAHRSAETLPSVFEAAADALRDCCRWGSSAQGGAATGAVSTARS